MSEAWGTLDSPVRSVGALIVEVCVHGSNGQTLDLVQAKHRAYRVATNAEEETAR